MESGRDLPRLTRFEGPITIALTGDGAADRAGGPGPGDRAVAGRGGAGCDSGAARTGLDHHRIPAAQAAAGGGAAGGLLRGAAGVELVGIPRRRGARDRVDWATLTTREKVAIFVPSDTSPQEVRDCLHEELAQALGPLNDLYELSDSVFNDDNFHTVLTGFDMLVLRVHYAPELANGMTRAEVAARLPALAGPAQSRGASVRAAAAGPTHAARMDRRRSRRRSGREHRGQSTAAGGAAGAGHRPGRRAGGMRGLGFSWFALGRLRHGRRDGPCGDRPWPRPRRSIARLPDAGDSPCPYRHADGGLCPVGGPAGGGDPAGRPGQTRGDPGPRMRPCWPAC